MSKVISFRPSVGFLALTSLLCVSCVDWSQAKPIAGSVQLVSDKLEAYALGKVRSSGLSIEDLKRALEEAQSWDQSEFVRRKESEPTFSLLVDFLFVPMLKYTDPTRDGVSQEPGSTARQDYIARLEKYYKIFRPAYFGKMIDRASYRSPKTDQLINSLIGAKGSKPLTKKLFDEALIEYDALMQRADDIRTHEDIFSCALELKLIYNYRNEPLEVTLKEKLFPLVKTQSNVDGLKDVFKTEIRKHGISIIGGRLYNRAR